MKTFVPSKSMNLITSALLALASMVPGAAAVLRVPNQYATIQAAVDAAASGDTIRIAAGIYEEQVLIASKNLKLIGVPGAVLRAKPGMIETLLPIDPTTAQLRPVVGVIFADDVTVEGLTVDGGRLGEVNYAMFGVIFHGSSGRMEHCTIRGFRGDPGLEFGSGFAAGNFATTGRPVQQVRVFNNLFEDNWTSVEVSGADGTAPNPLHVKFVIQGNRIKGIGPTDVGTQTGIQLNPGVSGVVRGNEITDHDCTGPAYNFSYGINASDRSGNLIPMQPIRYEGNTFRNNQEHIVATTSDGSQFVNNSFQGSSTGTRPNGIAASGDNLQIVNNDFEDLPTGITLFGDDPDFGTALGIATNVKLIANRFCHVGEPIVVEPLVTDVTEHGTKLCADRDCRGHHSGNGHDRDGSEEADNR